MDAFRSVLWLALTAAALVTAAHIPEAFRDARVASQGVEGLTPVERTLLPARSFDISTEFLVPLAAVTVLATVPWRAWLATHDARDNSDYRLGDAFDLGLLWDRIDRLGIAAREFPQYVLDPGRWLLAVPLTLVLAALLSRRRPALAGFCAGPSSSSSSPTPSSGSASQRSASISTRRRSGSPRTSPSSPRRSSLS